MMAQLCYNIKPVVFEKLAQQKKDAAVLFYGVLLRGLADGQGPAHLPRVNLRDARALWRPVLWLKSMKDVLP